MGQKGAQAAPGGRVGRAPAPRRLWLPLARTWTRPATRQSRRSSSPSSCTLRRAWRWTGSTSTSTGPTQATRPSQWPHLMVAADALFSATTSVSPGPSPSTPCEGECPHLGLPALPPSATVPQSPGICHQSYLRASESLRRSPWEESLCRSLSLQDSTAHPSYHRISNKASQSRAGPGDCW